MKKRGWWDDMAIFSFVNIYYFFCPLNSFNNKCQSQPVIDSYGKLLRQITLNIYLLNQG